MIVLATRDETARRRWRDALDDASIRDVRDRAGLARALGVRRDTRSVNASASPSRAPGPPGRVRASGGLGGPSRPPMNTVAGRSHSAASARGEQYTVVLLDLKVPGLGTGAIPRLARRKPAACVIALTPRPSEREGIRVLRAGARGYCARDVDGALLRKAVAVVQKGEVWASRRLIARLVDALGAATRQRARTASARTTRRLGVLTARERETALLVGGGASNKEIAHRLGVTERTVKAHLTAIFRKLGIADRLRLALLLNGSSAPPLATV